MPIRRARCQGCFLAPTLSSWRLDDYLTTPIPSPRLRPLFMKVLICDPISPKGIELFKQRPEFQVTVLDKRLSEAAYLADWFP